MAIVSGFIQSKYRKSIGNVTYAMLGGDIIAREKITTNASNTALQAAQRSLFKQSMSFIRWLNPYANIAYRRNGRRSAYAEFTKSVYPGVASLLAVNEDALDAEYGSFIAAMGKANELTGGNTPFVQGDFRPISVFISDVSKNASFPGTMNAFGVRFILPSLPASLKLRGEEEELPDARNRATISLMVPGTSSTGSFRVVESESVTPSKYTVALLPSGFVEVYVLFSAPAGSVAFNDGIGYSDTSVISYGIPLIRVPGLGVVRLDQSALRK